MATQTSLRAVTHRLTTTPVKELPQIAPHLAASLGDCGQILSAPQNQKGAKGNPESALLVHKLKARVSSLLQDHTVEGRWTGVILVKAAVEVGQWELLRGCEPWIRGLMAILNKPDPTSTKRLCIITLTRIFHLTHDYQTLVREITTPTLPSFITACMNAVSIKSPSEPTRKLRQKTPLLRTVLHALLELIPRHPTIFRPFSSQIHSLILPFVVSTLSTTHPDAESVVILSQQLFISLHHCAPKNTASDEWAAACKSTVHSIHQTADHLFRAIVEQWESTDATRNQTPKPKSRTEVVGDDGPDPLGMPGWRGLRDGAERLRSLLKLLAHFVSIRTNSAVFVPLGLILDLTSRLNSITVPFEDADGLQNAAQYNPEISKEEREDLLTELPSIHVETLNLLSRLAGTFGGGIASISQDIVEQTLWVFEAERFSKDVRASTYQILNSLLPIFGPSISKSTMSSLSLAMRSCCYDLSLTSMAGNPEEHHNPESRAKPNGRGATGNADSFLAPKSADLTAKVVDPCPGLTTAASRLLPSVLHYLPIEHISSHLRTEIDRTAILTNNRNVMLASVVNPGPAVKGKRENPSIAPFLARSHPGELEVESFLRPRMPILLRGHQLGGKLFDAEKSDVGDAENAVPSRITASGNMFMDNSGVSSTTTVPQEPEPVSTNRNKRSYPIDSQPSAVQIPPLSAVEDQELGAPKPKNPRLENGGSHHVGKQNEVEPVIPANPTASATWNGIQPAPTSSITHTSRSVASPDATVSSIKVTQVEPSAQDSSSNRRSGVITSTITSTSFSVSGSSAAPATHSPMDDSSGDEIPTLDIEPDTDEDEEDTEMVG
ncbi:hypothetical protein FQN54_007508 [Arachnomyces sp. PD_36]|nr:hypothetical protein FQN54_007508 [Arachnomyces sp. PD_36]